MNFTIPIYTFIRNLFIIIIYMFHNNSYLFLIVIVIVALFFAYPKDENFLFNISKESFDNFSETNTI